MRLALGSLLLALPLLVAGPATQASAPASAQAAPSAGTAPAAAQATAAVPALDVSVVAEGLTLPWDVQELPSGELLVTQRRGGLLLISGGQVLPVGYPNGRVWVSGETGLMGLAIDPDFASNKRIYTCQGGTRSDGTHDVRVLALTLSTTAPRRATGVSILRHSFPATTGQHGGCRLLITSDGALLVGTGDAATGTTPRSLASYGGKTLRMDRFTGAPWPANRWASSGGVRAYVHTYGHRNVQGVAERSDGTLWSIEQGTGVEDEANLLVNGGDYGWNPVPVRPGTTYNQNVPMTDQSLPGPQIDAKWSSGPTPASSGGSFVEGAQWGDLDGALAVACLQAQQVLFLTFDADGTLVRQTAPAELTQYGRMRTVTRAANGDLLMTTSNGPEQDYVLRVRPAAG